MTSEFSWAGLRLEKGQGFAPNPDRGLCPLDPQQRHAFAIRPLMGEQEGADRGVARSVLAPSCSPIKMSGSKGEPLAGSRGRAPGRGLG
jgi:hypothetical protein